MISAFGVDHGQIEKAFKLPKPGKIFGRAGAINRTSSSGKSKPFQAGQKTGSAIRSGFHGIGTGAGKAASGVGFGRLGAQMQKSPVKAGVTTSFLAGGVGYGVYGQTKNKQPGQGG